MSGSHICGMTGFGRADGGLDGWTWTVEARSVNGRTLETRFRGPGGFDNLERLAKAAAQARLNRGQVTLGLQAKRAEGFEPAPRVNEAVLATYLRLANQLAQEGPLRPPLTACWPCAASSRSPKRMRTRKAAPPWKAPWPPRSSRRWMR
ncbi:YicC/YloC family endoribonuclease [Brevundimonas sp. LF-1]|uniref:YicC/YloC family endoribonuclease n=1 Tax=Brevundimonas sp. LF-1 TaxID=3126100 RepID=UPI0030DFFE03